MKKFDYKSAYKKYHSGDTVKITFMDDKVPITKTVRIISIDDKKVSFEDKENVYECTSSEIINIKNTFFKLLRAFIWLELFLIIGFVLFIFQDYTFSISGAYGSVHYKTEAILIWLLIFIGTFVIPLRTRNPKIMLWGLYPLISVPLLIFFGADTLGIHIIEQSPDFGSIFSSEYLYIASQFLLYPFAIIIAEFVCNYPKSPLTKKRLVILFYWLAFLYVCILGIRILNENKYWEECQKDASYMGNGYFGQYNVFTGCSLIYDRTWNYGGIEYLED